MTKIQMKMPLVEMDGDEMTRILWKMIKDELLIPYIELNTIYSNLKGLTIGPTPLMHHSYSSVEMFLKNVRNNNKDLEFLKPNRSDVPYRTW